MCKNLIFVLLILLLKLSANAQNRPKLPPGFPDRSPYMDVLPGFRTPPRGYGEVSFYWWIGDTLTQDRILWQLDQLKDKGITGLQINYCHTDKGGASYGLTYPSQPALFSEKWWKLFQWFLKEAKQRDMSVSLSDYTLGAAGQGWFVDEMLEENPKLHGTKLEARLFEVKGGMEFRSTLPADLLSAYAFPVVEGKPSVLKQLNLMPSVRNSDLVWKAPAGDWKIVVVYKTTVNTSFDPMNPLSGPKTIEKFYQRFEDHCPGEGGKGLNFFFSDELQFGIRGFLWNDSFSAEFKKRKGYEITPELSHLFIDLSPRSYKIRMDYNDVMVALSEDGFFKPVYKWHYDRGMLFGCDHGGRGRDVTEFGDYFRTQRWMSGPGCDQPGLGRDMIKNKVASSIAHLYERPRTWLEGFYGSGWGTSSEEVADATFANFAMGHNLLSLHGLYYTTHGSWWEWAAPDNHFRQPYWSGMGSFLKCSERLSYVLSQGHHRCDVAIIYPVSPTVAGLKGKESTETAFAIARDLYPGGIDFDFMDDESLYKSKVENEELLVSGEKYKVLILPALSAVQFETMTKALSFFRAGGIVFAVGALPEASNRIGGNDPKLQAICMEMFGTTFS
ncbi:MAG TPA: glycosyl hydrolase, partial [Prolixibacteraceae bacterium]|nr:glycosyl hydrolase [Prolixibacteraceae bacterium]